VSEEFLKMKKAYLLAGSISLFGLLAGNFSAQAAIENSNESAGSEASAAALLPEVAQPVTPLIAVSLPTESAPAPAVAVAPEASPLLADATSVSASVDQLASSEATMGQVTSVSQLSDVKPTDWAFQALQSLVEKYGCIAGYPDGTFRGNRAATRYELAAALNACLDVISDRFATKEDLATLRKLQEEFAAELATLRGRVDSLEARTARLEATQFSTTTKLQGLAVISFQAGGFGSIAPSDPFNQPIVASNNPIIPGLAINNDVNATVIATTFLSFNTSFTGDDLLQTTLAFGNGGLDTIGVVSPGITPGAPNIFPGQGAAGPYFNPGQYYWSGFPSSGFLYRLAYTFKPWKDVTITAGPQFYAADIIDYNSYANAPASDFGSYFFINNTFIIPYALNFLGGAGAAVQWNPGGGPFTLKALYMAGNAGIASRTQSDFGGGFAGDPYQASVELTYARPFSKDGKNNFAVRLQYTNATVFNVNSNAIGVNAEATFGRFGVFGRFGYAFLDSPVGFNPLPYSDLLGVTTTNQYDAITFMGGVAYRDLIVPGSLLAVAAGAPFITQGADVADPLGLVNNANQVNVEAFYRFPVTDNISITPIFSAIFNPNNSSANETIYQGVLRSTFTF
jgi:hypothetical protein